MKGGSPQHHGREEAAWTARSRRPRALHRKLRRYRRTVQPAARGVMDASNHGELDWVLVLAPYRKDAAYIEMLLVEHGMVVRACADTDDLVRKLPQSPGVIIATHESPHPPTIEAIANHLTTQPNWSDLPIFVLLDRTAQQSRIRAELDRRWPRSRQLFFQRPVASLELVSGVQSALLVRLRQREVRDSSSGKGNFVSTEPPRQKYPCQRDIDFSHDPPRCRHDRCSYR